MPVARELSMASRSPREGTDLMRDIPPPSYDSVAVSQPPLSLSVLQQQQAPSLVQLPQQSLQAATQEVAKRKAAEVFAICWQHVVRARAVGRDRVKVRVDNVDPYVALTTDVARSELRRKAAEHNMAVAVWPVVPGHGWIIVLDWSQTYRLPCAACSCWIPSFFAACCWWRCDNWIWFPCGTTGCCCCEP
jgi:hypothetical protein